MSIVSVSYHATSLTRVMMFNLIATVFIIWLIVKYKSNRIGGLQTFLPNE